MATIAHSRRRRFVTVTTAFLAVAIMSVAAAAWLANGEGEGYAKSDTAQDLGTLDAVTATLTEDLYPGSIEGDLHIVIDNPNRYPVTISQIAQDGDAVIKAEGSVDTGSECVATAVTLTPSTVEWDVPAENDAEFTLANVVHMDGNAGNQCQGATFTIPVTFSGASDAS